MTQKYRPRLNIELAPEKKKRVDALLGSWGQKRRVYSALTDGLLKLSEDKKQWTAFMGRVATNTVDVKELT